MHLLVVVAISCVDLHERCLKMVKENHATVLCTNLIKTSPIVESGPQLLIFSFTSIFGKADQFTSAIPSNKGLFKGKMDFSMVIKIDFTVSEIAGSGKL